MGLYQMKLNNDILNDLETIELDIDIPVVENTRLNNNIVRINDLVTFNDYNGYTISEGIEKLKDINQIDTLLISVDESTAIENPWLLNLNNIVLSKISEDTELYNITDFVLKEYFINKNEKILDIFLESEDLDDLQMTFTELTVPGMDSLINNVKNVANKVKDQATNTFNQVRNSEMVKNAEKTAKEAIDKVKNSETVQNLQAKGKELYNQGKEFVSNNSDTLIAGAGGMGAGYLLGKNSGNDQNQAQPVPNQTVNKPGFFAQKLAAIKRWLNQNFGTNFDISEAYLDDMINKIVINEVYRPRRKYHVRYTY